MKNTYYKHIAIILLFLTGLSSCVDNTFTASAEKEVSADFSLDEAKCYYQRQAKSCGIMADNINKITLSPGDIVPQWNSAVFSMQGNVACYDIPVNASYSYQAIRSQKRNGILTAEKSGVYQRLIILKNLANKQLSHYILSLIPDKSCEQQCKQDAFSIFRTRGNKSRFSGIAMYSLLYKSRIIEVDLYSQGNKTSGVSLLDIKGYDDCKIKTCKLKDVLSSISFQKRKKLITRGEYDIDGVWLDEVVITPDEPWDGTGADGMTNEEWLDSTRPDGNVDQEPEPEPELPEGDYSQVEEEPVEKNEPEISGFNTEEEAKVKAAIDNLHVRLPNIDLKDIRIEKGERGAKAYVKPTDGTIVICDRYFHKEYNNIDRSSILYHELIHNFNEHYKSSIEVKNVDELMKDPPENIKQSIMDDIKKTCPYYNEDDIKLVYQQALVVDKICNTEFYSNELEAYKNEKQEFSDNEISETYKNEREYNMWVYQQLLEMSEKYY